MKKIASCLPLLTAVVVVSPAANPPTADTARPVESRISEVVVYADRAQVTRAATVTLPTDPACFAFEKLPGWIDEGSVRVGCTPADAGQVLDVQVRRAYLARATDEDFQRAELAVRESADQLAAIEDEKALLDAEARHIDSIRVFAADKLPRDTASREVKPEEYAQSLKFVSGSLREIAAARREVERKKRDLLPELNARQRKLDELRQRAQLEQCAVVVTARGSGKPSSLTLTYLLPGATWEPVHELRATAAADSLNLASFAVVMQTSGEDWTDAALSFSTQRSAETMRIPELEALLVGGTRLPRLVRQTDDTFKAALMNWDAQNGLWNNYVNPGAPFQQKEYLDNRTQQLDNARRIERVFETLQQRGTTAHFPALARQTIRSDGRPVRVPIGQARLAAQHRILAAPELSLNAARLVDLTNTTGQPLLPGRVSLFLGGAFLGHTETEFVGPGEGFPLYLGVADQVKLSRTLDKKRSTLIRGGTKTRMQVSFVVALENLGAEPVAVQLTDRVPVSETDDVRIFAVKVQPETKPDTKGLLRWDASLPPKQSKEFRIEYSLEYPANLAAISEAVRKSDAPSSRSYRLNDQIQSLEKQF
jgi:uncharacterized protein (TIGR02231 family)